MAAAARSEGEGAGSAREAAPAAAPAPRARRARRGAGRRAAVGGVGACVLVSTGGGEPTAAAAAPAAPAQQASSASDAPVAEQDERVLISEVVLRGSEGDEALEAIARSALSVKPNFAYTLREVQEDVERIFATGYFASCTPEAEDTRDGVRLTVNLEPNPELTGVVLKGAKVLPAVVVEDVFAELYGRTLNFAQFKAGLEKLNSWYEARGLFGQVVDVEMSAAGVANVKVAEAVVRNVSVRTLDKETMEPVQEAKTKPEIVMRHISTKPGQVYSLQQAKRDVEAVYQTSVMEDVNMLPKPAPEEGQIDLQVNVVERATGGFSAGGGISPTSMTRGALSGVVGSADYSHNNLFGLNQKLSCKLELGQLETLFRLHHSDPWVGTDKHRTGRTISLQNTRTVGNHVHSPVVQGGADGAANSPEAAQDQQESLAISNSPGVGMAAALGPGVMRRWSRADDAASGASPRPGTPEATNGTSEDGGEEADAAKSPLGEQLTIARTVAGVEWSRPLTTKWAGTFGVSLQQAGVRDNTGKAIKEDALGLPVTHSGDFFDHMAVMKAEAIYSAGSGGQMMVSSEQSLPIGDRALRFNRVRARAAKGAAVGPVVVAVSFAGGKVMGDLPPHEAFPIGGTNSVRGYDEGAVGSGRDYVVGSAELQVPLVAPLEGVVFLDVGSDLGTGAKVKGNPAGARGKPGYGHGAGVGVRVDTPIGPLRLEHAWNDAGKGRTHFGIGFRI